MRRFVRTGAFALLLVIASRASVADEAGPVIPAGTPVTPVPPGAAAPAGVMPVHLVRQRTPAPPIDAPRVVPTPPPIPPDGVLPHGNAAPAPRWIYIPAHLETHPETVCDPAVYEPRRVPVYETRCTPIFETVTVALYEDHVEPRTELRMDVATGQLKAVVVGMKTVHIHVGFRTERRRVGSRNDRVKVGTRWESVLVRPASCRTETRETWVPGRYLSAEPPLDPLPAPAPDPFPLRRDAPH